MAVSRPNVVVYQEYSALSIIADTPEMEVLVVGPCYQILDYLDDKDDCYADEYGTLNAHTENPMTWPVAVDITSPPNIQPGGLLDDSSVRMFLDDARVVLVTSNDGDTNLDGIFSSGDTLFEAYVATTGADFIDSGAAAGDILVFNTGATTQTASTVGSVRAVLQDAGTVYAFLNGNGTYAALVAGDIITISDDTISPATLSRNGTYTVKYVRSDTAVEIEGASWPSTYAANLGGAVFTITVTTSTGIVKTGYNAKTNAAMFNTSCLRMNPDFTVSASTTKWRLERTVSDIELAAADFTVVDNAVTVAANITVDLSSDLTGLNVSYGKIYMEYKALRTDLTQPISYQSTNELLSAIGKYDARNPLAVGAIVAKANTSTSVKVYGLDSDDITGYQTFLDNISSVREIYAIVPLTTDTSILAMIKNDCEQLADPNYVLTAGIRQKFRACIGSVVKPVEKLLVPVSANATTKQLAATGPTAKRKMTITASNFTLVFNGSGAACVVPGDTVTTIETGAGVTKTYRVSQVLASDSLEVDITSDVITEYGTGSELAIGDTFKVFVGTSTVVRVGKVLAGTETVKVVSAAMDSCWCILEDITADFVTAGVTAGDIIYMPAVPNADFVSTTSAWVVDQRLSSNRLSIINNGKNTISIENEFPHGVLRAGTGASVSQGHMYYKVTRVMSKDQQVDDMVAVATSFASKRTLLCYPDSVVVTDLVDGSLARTDSDTPEAAAAQPGYYLSCAVGGQTAGQPTQQGFTNLGIAGITSISGSSGYFKETQLTELSNGGVYVFVQDNPSSLPYSIHEVTTDVSSLEFGEYMVTKNFDYVALTFLDSMLPFIGRWNLLPTTLDYMRDGLNQIGVSLKKRVVAKIGAPLTSYEIVSVSASDVSSDRADAYINVNLPMTLNTIGIHLVA